MGQTGELANMEYVVSAVEMGLSLGVWESLVLGAHT